MEGSLVEFVAHAYVGYLVFIITRQKLPGLSGRLHMKGRSSTVTVTPATEYGLPKTKDTGTSMDQRSVPPIAVSVVRQRWRTHG